MLMITGAIILNAGAIALTSNRSDGLTVLAFPLGLFLRIGGIVEHVQSTKAQG